MNQAQLLKAKEQIDKAKSLLSEMKGRKKYLLEELNEKYGCETVAKAIKKSQKMEKEEDDFTRQIDELVKTMPKPKGRDDDDG